MSFESIKNKTPALVAKIILSEFSASITNNALPEALLFFISNPASSLAPTNSLKPIPNLVSLDTIFGRSSSFWLSLPPKLIAKGAITYEPEKGIGPTPLPKACDIATA